jgi:hypothetical protein
MENYTYSYKIGSIVPLLNHISHSNVVFLELDHHIGNEEYCMCTLKNPNFSDVRVTRPIPVLFQEIAERDYSTRFATKIEAMNAGILCFIRYYKPSGYELSINNKLLKV